MVSDVLIETESLFRKCFFMQHNLAGRFAMLGMDHCERCARHADSILALFPPIHKQYPLQELSREASLHMEIVWGSPFLLSQCITTCKLEWQKSRYRSQGVST